MEPIIASRQKITGIRLVDNRTRQHFDRKEQNFSYDRLSTPVYGIWPMAPEKKASVGCDKKAPSQKFSICQLKFRSAWIPLHNSTLIG